MPCSMLGWSLVVRLARWQQAVLACRHCISMAGGGAASTKWTDIRQARLPVPVIASPQAESCYGAAMLAREGWLRNRGLVGPLQELDLV